MITWQGPAMPQVWQFIQLDALIFLRALFSMDHFVPSRAKPLAGIPSFDTMNRRIVSNRQFRRAK